MAQRDTAPPESRDTDAKLQAHLAELEAEALAEEELTSPADGVLSEASPFQRVRDDLDHVRNEIELLRKRLSPVRRQTTAVARSNLKWADASAHAQLGAYPWAKLFAAMAATVAGAQVLRRLPLGAIAAAVIPLLVAQLEAKSRR
ncbi:hypothetical protein [Rhizobium sullae]|uniref:Uncharacterized protein n=1 Tax=Rhizobium sullae TaxID=50338 RepID=A0A4R3PSP8_RHISU|nr:hypothetical protein [Rhizobium sullae]TCU09636.1 hypothetical protein EV132_12436 [Rhizobium sullae]